MVGKVKRERHTQVKSHHEWNYGASLKEGASLKRKEAESNARVSQVEGVEENSLKKLVDQLINYLDSGLKMIFTVFSIRLVLYFFYWVDIYRVFEFNYKDFARSVDAGDVVVALLRYFVFVISYGFMIGYLIYSSYGEYK